MKTPQRWFALLVFVLMPFVAAAQQGLEIDIVGGSASALPITVVPIPYQGSGTPPETDVAKLVRDDLARSGVFRPLPENQIVQRPTRGNEVDYATWKQLRQLQQAQQRQTAAPTPAAASAGTGGQGGSSDDLTSRYAAAIQQAVLGQWTRPDSVPLGTRCRIIIKQLPGGEVMSAEVQPGCAMDQAGQDSLERAVRRAQPLPYRGFESVFNRQLNFNFEAQDR